MDKNQVIERLTKAVVNARLSLIYIHHEAKTVVRMGKCVKEAEDAIRDLEYALRETLIDNDIQKEYTH